jgi:hypothetical protein
VCAIKAISPGKYENDDYATVFIAFPAKVRSGFSKDNAQKQIVTAVSAIQS